MAEKLLRVTAPHFCAGAIWRKDSNGWRCIDAAPILGWMIGKHPDYVRAYLDRKGYLREWV
jgi:hypothetical protein